MPNHCYPFPYIEDVLRRLGGFHSIYMTVHVYIFPISAMDDIRCLFIY